MIKKTYETERLQLQLSDTHLAKRVAEFYTRNREFLQSSEPRKEKTFYTDSFQRRALARDYKAAQDLVAAKFWLLPKENPDKGDIIGMVGLSNIMFGPSRSAFVSYKLDGGHTGQGLMGEALQKLIAIAFEDIELHRLEANIMPRNTASLRVVEKLGFENEGLAKKYLKIDDVWEDHIHMVLLNEGA